ncbi:hypothetical protein FKW31_09990 [Acetobacter sp. DmW_136]|uniref:hypothetical protein n=1 Tax=Acetobacter sp. DmW_136 TaxID=2591091 RepID=UPI0012399FF1|nr:hypothetical protein [Acetobacter sp. DmW_136]KAA8385132.1 hypothetical protein FKW31_09990 [Acetobacter sp. DmW_136]
MTDRRKLALECLQITYDNIRTQIMEAGENADFTFVAGLGVINVEGNDFMCFQNHFGNPNYILGAASIVFGDATVRHVPKNAKPEKIADIINNGIQVGRGDSIDIVMDGMPCSTAKH